MEMRILFENDEMVAVDKPAGVMTHPDGVNKEETASDWFARMYPESAGVGETQTLTSGEVIARPGIVHRLDRDTSGVLVLAKTQEAHERLKKAFTDRAAKKTYLALVYGVPKDREGVIAFPIGRSRKDFRLRSAQPKARGTMREAITHYRVLSDTGTHALLELSPKTGRTHQIRVHLKAIHHPVVSDPLYAPGYPKALQMERLALHAYKLELPGMDPLIAPLPEDMKRAIAGFPDTAYLLG